MSRDRGIRLQNVLAKYLRGEGWPAAESAGSGRPGTDILGIAGTVWENKTADEFSPKEWARQARSHTVCAFCGEKHWMDAGPPKDIPVVVYWPRGMGAESVASTISMIPTGVLVRLLREAGY